MQPVWLFNHIQKQQINLLFYSLWREVCHGRHSNNKSTSMPLLVCLAYKINVQWGHLTTYHIMCKGIEVMDINLMAGWLYKTSKHLTQCALHFKALIDLKQLQAHFKRYVMKLVLIAQMLKWALKHCNGRRFTWVFYTVVFVVRTTSKNKTL